MKKKVVKSAPRVSNMAIESTLWSLMENTKWDEEKIIVKVAVMYGVDASRVSRIMSKLD